MRKRIEGLAEPPEASDAREIERLSALYYELLFAVGEKHPGETRHQTALRYIQQAEAREATPTQQREVKR